MTGSIPRHWTSTRWIAVGAAWALFAWSFSLPAVTSPEWGTPAGLHLAALTLLLGLPGVIGDPEGLFFLLLVAVNLWVAGAPIWLRAAPRRAVRVVALAAAALVFTPLVWLPQELRALVEMRIGYYVWAASVGLVSLAILTSGARRSAPLSAPTSLPRSAAGGPAHSR